MISITNGIDLTEQNTGEPVSWKHIFKYTKSAVTWRLATPKDSSFQQWMEIIF